MAAAASTAGQVSESTERVDLDDVERQRDLAEHDDEVDDVGRTGDSDAAGDDDIGGAQSARIPASRLRLAIAFGLIVVVALGGLGGWLGDRAYEVRQAQHRHDLFLQVGRQAALNLTTISHTEADADVQRILDSATGTFYDEFKERAPAFVDVVKKAQSITQGTVTAAGVESEQDDRAQVLVAVAVKTSNAGAREQQPRAWRMRVTVQKLGDGAKVADVAFVP
jgi:Mce-associated membrane protein